MKMSNLMMVSRTTALIEEFVITHRNVVRRMRISIRIGREDRKKETASGSVESTDELGSRKASTALLISKQS